MTTITISPKFQVLIPKKIRLKLNIKANQKLLLFQTEGRIEMIPVKNIKESRGFLKGIDINIDRE